MLGEAKSHYWSRLPCQPGCYFRSHLEARIKNDQKVWKCGCLSYLAKRPKKRLSAQVWQSKLFSFGSAFKKKYKKEKKRTKKNKNKEIKNKNKKLHRKNTKNAGQLVRKAVWRREERPAQQGEAARQLRKTLWRCASEGFGRRHG